MATNTGDWQGLSGAIHNLGSDQFNAGLGLARLVSEDRANAATVRARDAETALSNIKRQTAEIDLRKGLSNEQYLNAPAMFRSTAMLLSPSGKDLDEDQQGLAHGLMTSMGWSVADPNGGPDQQIIDAQGNPLSNRDIMRKAPIISAYVMGSTDFFNRLTNQAETIKQGLGATSPGPWMTKDEVKTFKKDPANAEAMMEYDAVEKAHQQYDTGKGRFTIYTQQLNMLNQAEAMLKAVGGDTTDITARKASLIKNLEQYDKQQTERQYNLSPDQAKKLGLQAGLPVSEKIQENVNAGYAAIRGQEIHAGATLGAAKMALEQGKIASAQTTLFNHITSERKLAGETIENTYKNPVTGEYRDPRTGQLIPPNEMAGLISKAQEQGAIKAMQQAQDMGLLTSLKMNRPAGVFAAPPNIRQEFVAMGASLDALDKQVKDPAVKAMIKNAKSSAIAALQSDDSAAWDRGRQVLLDTTTQIQQLLKTKPPVNINKEVRDFRSDGAGLGDLNQYMIIPQ